MASVPGCYKYKNKARSLNRALLKTLSQNYLAAGAGAGLAAVLVEAGWAAGFASVLAAGLAAGLLAAVVFAAGFASVLVVAVWALTANTAKATDRVKKIFFMAFGLIFWVN
jgi:hypothetical protein